MLQILLSMLVKSFMKFIKLQMKKKVRGRGKENVQPAQRSAAEFEALSEGESDSSIIITRVE